jgi:NAD(P)H-hydrate epimerase
MLPAHPVLTCAESVAWEETILGSDEAKTRAAMLCAGEGVADAILKDYLEIRPIPARFRILVLLGTGHNAGDALIAVRKMLGEVPQAVVTAVLLYPRAKLRPLAEEALRELEKTGGQRVELREWDEAAAAKLAAESYEVCIEGVLGMQMKPPLRTPAPEVFATVAKMSIDLRAAVDLPAGLGDECAPDGFRADFTYATGIAKRPVFVPANLARTGRVRYIDIGFFGGANLTSTPTSILPPHALASLCALRPANADKRANGHVFIMGGSRSMPGAVCMATMAAVRAGAGLVTTFLPESLLPGVATLAPEAMWVPLPIENADVAGTLNAVKQIANRMTALVIGPGLDALDWNVRAVIGELIRETRAPIVIDASALIPEAVMAVDDRPDEFPPVVFTPHMGEFARLVGDKVFQPGCDLDATLTTFSKRHRCVTLLKGPVTRIADGERVICGSFGGPTLGRGGSGDILSGIIGALAAQPGADLFTCACLGALWHGAAAERLARERGQKAVRTTEILDHLSPCLREA